MAKLKFKTDGFVDGECLFQAGEVYEVPETSVDRWVRRGAVKVDEDGNEFPDLAEMAEDKKERDEKKGKKSKKDAGTELDQAPILPPVETVVVAEDEKKDDAKVETPHQHRPGRKTRQ